MAIKREVKFTARVALHVRKGKGIAFVSFDLPREIELQGPTMIQVARSNGKQGRARLDLMLVNPDGMGSASYSMGRCSAARPVCTPWGSEG